MVNRDLDAIFDRISRSIRSRGDFGNVDFAALAILCNRMIRDEKLLRRLIREYDFLQSASSLFSIPCDLCLGAVLHLAVSITQCSIKHPSHMAQIGRTLLPALVDAVRGREKDDVFSECVGMFFSNYIIGMLYDESDSNDGHARALVAGVLRYSTLIGRCGPGLMSYIVYFWSVVVAEGPQLLNDWGRPFFDVCFGILRVAGPLNRLYAIKAVYLHRRPGRPNPMFTNLLHPLPFNLDAVISNAQRLNIATEDPETPDVQGLMIRHVTIWTAFQKFYKSTERDFGRVAVSIALMLLEDPLALSLDGNIPVRYGLPDSSPRACAIPIDDWRDILKHGADILSRMSPRAINAARDACLTPPPASVSPSRQDLVDVLRTADLVLRRDFVALAGSPARAAFLRTQEMRCRAWFLYVLSQSPHAPDVALVFDTLTAGYRDGKAQHPDDLKSTATLMTMRNLAVHSLEWALGGMKEDLARSPTGLGVRVKDVITARGMAMMYLQICPVDARDGQTMAAVHILTKLLFDGPTLSSGFMDAEMDGLLQTYNRHKRSAAANWCDMRRSHLVPVVEMFIQHRVSGWRMFSGAGLKFHEKLPWPLWGELPECHDCFTAVSPRAIDNLTSLVHEQPARPVTWTKLPTEVFMTLVTGHPDQLNLYRCETCRAHSASLRRCSSCRNVRYCGRDCQRTHWRSGHREECTRAFL